ncbi:XRE family transcriptional regulator [Actinokineospora terrae]|uniref:XRE family transcriptional regulator n=1 Tax=Actinokineospora terrae TaxID=155974 RepID=UPI001FE66C93|nr:XRE family transcriptional regulator [Actinokineospora terrae]
MSSPDQDVLQPLGREDWAAVSNAINERMEELGWRQRILSERPQVSQSIIRELQYNTVERKRSTRTLEALSTALGFHSEHLYNVLRGETPSPSDDQSVKHDSLAQRLEVAIELLLHIAARIDGVDGSIRDCWRSNQRSARAGASA